MEIDPERLNQLYEIFDRNGGVGIHEYDLDEAKAVRIILQTRLDRVDIAITAKEMLENGSLDARVREVRETRDRGEGTLYSIEDLSDIRRDRSA